ncbi:hypothetical protein L4Z64_001288 [Pseudomonas aeruginosa]|nr:hypothetical protein [Pseudomonas aeruginosa]
MKRDLLASIGPESSPVKKAAKQVLREALDRAETHPCDEGDDAVAAQQLAPEMKALLGALLASKPLAETAIFLVMASSAGSPSIPLRAFEERHQAEAYAAMLIEYHISAPLGPDDEETWEDFATKQKAWAAAHPGGVAVSRYQQFGVYEIPYGPQQQIPSLAGEETP